MRFSEQIMSKNSIFSRQIEAVVVIILEIFFARFQLGNIQSRDPLRPIAREGKYLMSYNCKYHGFH